MMNSDTHQNFHVELSERVKNIRGSGIRKAFELAASMKDAIHLGLGEPDLSPPPELKELMKKAVDDDYSHYTPNQGMLELRQILAEKVERENGVKYDPVTEIIPTLGAMNAINLAMQCLVNPGDEVILQDPCFVGFEPLTISTSGVPVYVPLREEKEFRIQAEDIAQRITPRTKLMIINTPQNPTGAVLNREEIEKIAHLAQKHNIFVITDEVYEKMIYDRREHVSMSSLPGMKERVLMVHSFSKTLCICGWRIGYACGPAHLINMMTKIQQFNSVHPPAPVQRAISQYIKNSQPFVDEIVRVYTQRRDFMVEKLNNIEGLSCVKPGATFYIFLNIKELGMSDEDFAQYLLENHKLVTVPGSVFGPSGAGYIRICITLPTEILQIAIDRIQSAVSEIRNRCSDCTYCYEKKLKNRQ